MTELMIDVHPDSGIAVLRLDHGWVNAMDAELYQAVTVPCEAVAEGPARALVLTGAGSAFSAGSDLRLLLGGGPAYVEEFFPALAGMLGTLFPVPKPVVVAVNGTPSPAVVCSPRPRMSRVMASGPAEIGTPELKVGVPFPRIGLGILRYRLGDISRRIP